MRVRRLSVAVFAVGVLLTAIEVSAAIPDASWQGKVAAQVLLDTADGRSASFLVVLTSRADLGAAASLPTRQAKGRFVFDTLRAHSERTQAPIRALLDRLEVRYDPHWIVNLVAVVRGGRALVQMLASRPDVARVEPNDWVRSSILPVRAPVLAPTPTAPDGIGWNVSRVNAPAAWRRGFTGQGMVVGNIDTGFQWDHPALKPHYRGWDGSSADHNYNWFDEVAGSPVPVDANGHGTATLGPMVGDDGGSNKIGVAPGATWIGCRAMDENGEGSPETYIGCLEFMVAPTDLSGNNPDPTKAPVAVNNSWFCSLDDGECPDQAVLLPAIQDVRAAGIVPVVAAGNSGPDCSTIGAFGPPAQYDESFTIGAVTFENALASFSSRGPASFQGTRIKPDMVAPGEDVRTSWPPNTYAYESGTSMASPHLVGVIALIYSAKPSLIGNVSGTERLIERTASHYDSPECSSNGTYPNNLYGWGLPDAGRAVKP
ncbi:MAG TPA: S8 family serine peptidase [Actinomycetota bacterium]|nr:S8 family serine peptidase [Actinomycetota bacterium]